MRDFVFVFVVRWARVKTDIPTAVPPSTGPCFGRPIGGKEIQATRARPWPKIAQ